MKISFVGEELLKACWRHNTGKVYISRELVNAWKQIENDEVGDISKPACKLVQQEIESSPCMTSAAFIRAKKKEAMLDLRDSGSHTNPFRPGEGINFALSRDTRDYGNNYSFELAFFEITYRRPFLFRDVIIFDEKVC